MDSSHTCTSNKSSKLTENCSENLEKASKVLRRNLQHGSVTAAMARPLLVVSNCTGRKKLQLLLVRKLLWVSYLSGYLLSLNPSALATGEVVFVDFLSKINTSEVQGFPAEPSCTLVISGRLSVKITNFTHCTLGT